VLFDSTKQRDCTKYHRIPQRCIYYHLRYSLKPPTNSIQLPYTIAWTPVLQFIFFTALTCPPNFLWQQFLESVFPSKTQSSAATNGEKEKSEGATRAVVEPRLDIRATVLKFILDQTIGASLNTLAFILIMAGIKGESMEQATRMAQLEFWPLMVAGYRLWPVVSLLSYSVLSSVESRALLGSIAGLIWGIYLSLMAREI
jgi:hypothetical protein